MLSTVRKKKKPLSALPLYTLPAVFVCQADGRLGTIFWSGLAYVGSCAAGIPNENWGYGCFVKLVKELTVWMSKIDAMLRWCMPHLQLLKSRSWRPLNLLSSNEPTVGSCGTRAHRKEISYFYKPVKFLEYRRVHYIVDISCSTCCNLGRKPTTRRYSVTMFIASITIMKMDKNTDHQSMRVVPKSFIQYVVSSSSPFFSYQVHQWLSAC